MQRRTFLRVAGWALLGPGLAGCAASRRQPVRAPAPSREPVWLPPVRASRDRVIRTTVGLRPHRATGFVLRTERLDAKVVVHNYGHGGGGHSLAWGTGALAAEMALLAPARRAAVVGCGTAGLTAARQLQRRGFDVTIYAASVPPDTTSNMALAFFSPASGLFSADRPPETDRQFRRAAEIAYRELQLLAGRDYGVSWIDSYAFSDVAPGPSRNEGTETGLLPAGVAIRSGQVVLGPGEHPFPSTYATRSRVVRIEPDTYLEALVRDVLRAGGRIVVRRFRSRADLADLAEPVIVNCTGLGARELFGDEELVPIKGQLTLLVPQAEVDYFASGAGVSAMPRRDGIALGGTFERGNWSLEPDDEARGRILDTASRFFGAMRAPAAA